MYGFEKTTPSLLIAIERLPGFLISAIHEISLSLAHRISKALPCPTEHAKAIFLCKFSPLIVRAWLSVTGSELGETSVIMGTASNCTKWPDLEYALPFLDTSSVYEPGAVAGEMHSMLVDDTIMPLASIAPNLQVTLDSVAHE